MKRNDYVLLLIGYDQNTTGQYINKVDQKCGVKQDSWRQCNNVDFMANYVTNYYKTVLNAFKHGSGGSSFK